MELKLQCLIGNNRKVSLNIPRVACGGSDGFSGLSANHLLGAFSDFLVVQGGTTVLTEVLEIIGAEMLLMEETKNKKSLTILIKCSVLAAIT